MIFNQMKKKTYLVLLRGFLSVIFALIIATIARNFQLVIFLLSLILLLASILAFFGCVAKFLKIPGQWKKKFLEKHPEVASVIFFNCDIMVLDGKKPSVTNLKKNVAFRGLISTETPYRAFLENGGLELPFTFGARSFMPVHYIAEGEHKAIIRVPLCDDSCVDLEFSFNVSRGKKYQIFYDEEHQHLDIIDTTGEKDEYASRI